MQSNIDKSNLRQVIISYPNQLNLGREFAVKVKPTKKDFSNLIICGMGGSALPADLLSAYLNHDDKFNLPIHIGRSYDLPKQASKDSLVFISSYSGNTEETVSCFEQAMKLEATIVAFCAGGKIEEIAQENNIPCVKYQINYKNFQPRFANTYAFAAMQQVLTNIGLSAIIKRYPEIRPLPKENKGKELAKRLRNKIPVFYASNNFKILARNWKIKINENSKSPAFWNYFPELNHNEMVGFSQPLNQYFVVMLRDKNDHEKIKLRMDTVAKLYVEKGIETEIIELEGKDFLEKVLNALVLGDWVSYYLALEYNQDPTPVKMVEDFKKLVA